MAHLSKIFSKTPVDVPNRSGFDMSHENMLTMTCGTLIPVLCEEVLPNETYSLGYLCRAQLPPMATAFFGRVDMRIEAFFVPNRIVWSGWQNFVTMPDNNPFSTVVNRPTRVPYITATGTEFPGVKVKANAFLGAGSLMDYLGIKQTAIGVCDINNALPFLAYHKIYDEWYRNPNFTKPLFTPPHSGSITQNVSFLPYLSANDNGSSTGLGRILGVTSPNQDSILESVLFFRGNSNSSPVATDKHLFSLHQRQWGKDYYTTAALYPQSNGSINGATASPDATGKISIAALRNANVLQRWAERNNIAGYKYIDQMKATWGVRPSDAILDRPIFLGSSSFPLYCNSAFNNAGASGASNEKNPFSHQIGSDSGRMSGMGQDSLIDNFHSTEHGHIIVIASVVPHAYYGSGSRRYLRRSYIGDFANPLLQGLGEQALYKSELNGEGVGQSDDTIFGYQQQYSEYKYHDDEVHGLLRDGESLEAFALQRTFDGDFELGTEFVEIPKSFLDSVTAASFEMGAVTWADFSFQLKKVSPLSEYVIPTLGDMKNTHKEDVDYRGSYL